MSNDLRAKIRQLLADTSGQTLQDHANPDAPKTIPTYLQNPDAAESGKNIRRGVSLGSALMTSISARNPSILAEAAARQMLGTGFGQVQAKQAALNEALEDFDTGAKIASDRKERAAATLDQEPPVSVVILALKQLFGKEVYEWEPETIFMGLEDWNVGVTDELREKVNCGLCLALQPTFLNDITVFENCVRAMNDLDVDVTIVQKPDIPYLCAAIYEAAMVMEREQDLTDDMEFIDDIDTYVGLALFHDHYMLAPVELRFAQEVLEKNNANTEAIVPKLKEAWEVFRKELDGGDPRELQENIIDVQLAKLAGCYLYVKERMETIKHATEMLVGD